MTKKKEDQKLTKDQAEKKILTLKKDLFNIRFKKINNQINNPAQYNQIKKSIGKSNPIEIFPNLIININSEILLAKHLHYIISRNICGIFHHGSKNLINHEELIKNIVEKLNLKKINYKYVYTTNDNRYLSLLSNKNLFPKHLNFTFDSILKKIQ